MKILIQDKDMNEAREMAKTLRHLFSRPNWYCYTPITKDGIGGYNTIMIQVENLKDTSFEYGIEPESKPIYHLSETENKQVIITALNIPAAVIIAHIIDNMTWDAIMNKYPGLNEDMIRACLNHALQNEEITESMVKNNA